MKKTILLTKMFISFKRKAPIRKPLGRERPVVTNNMKFAKVFVVKSHNIIHILYNFFLIQCFFVIPEDLAWSAE